MATYQVWTAPGNATLSQFQTWAQFFGAGFTTLGWVAQTGHQELAATGSGASYAFSSPQLPAAALAAPLQYTLKGAWVSGNTYAGGNSAGLTTECDLVTFTGANYQLITNATVTGNNTALLAIPNTNGFVVGGTFTPTGITTAAFTQLNSLVFTITAVVANTSVTGTYGPACLTTQTTAACNGTCTSGTTLGICTYQKITASSTSTIPPCGDLTNWLPCQYEIWKSNGPNTASLPIFIKLTYTSAGSSAFRIHISVGTGVDANGNITNPLPFSASTGANVGAIDNSTSGNILTLGECDMAGDADNVRFVLWRNGVQMPSINYTNVMVIDRAKTNSGTDTDAFIYAGYIFAFGTAQTAKSAIIMNAALGGGIVVGTAGTSTNGWIGTVTCVGLSGSIALMGSAPVMPIFPLVGFCAPPLLGCVGVHRPDYVNSDGAVIPVWTYGAAHNYMVLTAINASAGSLDNQGATAAMSPCILWE